MLGRKVTEVHVRAALELHALNCRELKSSHPNSRRHPDDGNHSYNKNKKKR